MRDIYIQVERVKKFKAGCGGYGRVHLQSTDRGRNFSGVHIKHALPYVTTVQLHERLLCDVETSPGSVNGRDVNRHPRRRVCDVPARAAIGRIPDDIESAANERERGNVAERRES